MLINSFKHTTLLSRGSVEKLKQHHFKENKTVICLTFSSLFVKDLCAHDLSYAVLVVRHMNICSGCYTVC